MAGERNRSRTNGEKKRTWNYNQLERKLFPNSCLQNRLEVALNLKNIPFNGARQLLGTRGTYVKLEKRFAKCNEVMNVMKFQPETWTIKTSQQKYLESFEVWW